MTTKPISGRTIFAMFLVVWVGVGFFGPGYEGIKNNAVPRLGLAFNIIQKHSLTIDEFQGFGPDKAFYDGHYYADKAPGLSLTSLPIIYAAIAVVRGVGGDPQPLRDGHFTDFALLAAHLATTLVNGLALALCVVQIALICRRFNLSSNAALFGGLALGIASPAFGWATMFLGHSLAGSCLFLGFARTLMADLPSLHGRRRLAEGLITGLLLTWACVVEYTTALPVIVVGLFGLWRMRAEPRVDQLLLAAGVLSGLLVGALPLLIYNDLAFGSPFAIGYQYVVGFDAMKQGSMGFALPSPDVALQLLFGGYRGLVWLFPLMLALPFAWRASRRVFPTDAFVIMVAIPVLYLTVNSGYFDWSGGASTGPRHLIPSLPFLCLAFAALWDRAGATLARSALVGLFLVSVAISLVAISVTMGAPNTPDQPLVGFLLRFFLEGRIHNALDFALRAFPFWRAPGAMHLITLLALPVLWLGVIAIVQAPRLLAQRASA